jgi:hypothetical protein
MMKTAGDHLRLLDRARSKRTTTDTDTSADDAVNRHFLAVGR